MAETVSKYKQTDKLKKILTVHDECTMTCVKCYKQFSMSQDQVMALMLSGLQVECGKCNEPSTTTVDSTVDGQDNEANGEIPTITNEQVFKMTCTTCGVTANISSDEAAEAFLSGTTTCRKCKNSSTGGINST